MSRTNNSTQQRSASTGATRSAANASGQNGKKARSKKKNSKTEGGLKVDFSSLTGLSLQALSALFGAMHQANKRSPVISGSLKVGKKKKSK